MADSDKGGSAQMILQTVHVSLDVSLNGQDTVLCCQNISRAGQRTQLDKIRTVDAENHVSSLSTVDWRFMSMADSLEERERLTFGDGYMGVIQEPISKNSHTQPLNFQTLP